MQYLILKVKWKTNKEEAISVEPFNNLNLQKEFLYLHHVNDSKKDCEDNKALLDLAGD